MKKRLLAILLALTLLLASLPAVLAEDDAPEQERVEQAEVREEVKSEPVMEAREQEPPKEEPEPARDEPEEDKPDSPEPIEDKPVVVIPSEPSAPEPEPEPDPEPIPQTDDADGAPARDASEGTEAGSDEESESDACKHENVKRVIDRKAANIAYTDLKDGTHRVTGKAVFRTVCLDCEKVLKTADSVTEKCAYTPTEAGLVCVYCGHLDGDDGSHEHSFTDGPYYTAGDHVDTVFSREDPALYHVERYQKLAHYKCDQCDTFGPATLVEGEYIEQNANHVWDGDTCAVCGYSASCAHDGETRVATWSEVVSCEYVSADVHLLKEKVYAQTVCAKCGEALGDPVVRESEQTLPHNFENGVCGDCGYACPHDHVDGTEKRGAACYEPFDEEGHVEARPILITGVCEDCGMKVKNLEREPEIAGYEAHSWRNGTCRKCGYACEHPDDAIIEKTSRPGYDYYEADRESHLVVYTEVYRISCGICGAVLFEDVDTLGSFYEDHEMANGECVLCGYERHRRDEDEEEDDEDDDKDEKDDDGGWFAFVDLPSADRLNGVAVIDGLTMLETARRVGDDMQRAVDAGYMSASVVNIDQIFNTEEQAALKALPVRDQLITCLYFLGYRDVVLGGMAQDTTLVTDATRSLIGQIDRRISAMSDADRKALGNAIRRYFPLADYQPRPGITDEIFNLDLRVVENNVVTTERYGFQRSGSDWVLINIAARAG